MLIAHGPVYPQKKGMNIVRPRTETLVVGGAIN
jgi:hypothetical protein